MSADDFPGRWPGFMRWAVPAFIVLCLAGMVAIAMRNSYLEERACTAAGGSPYPGNGWVNYQACIFGEHVRVRR